MDNDSTSTQALQQLANAVTKISEAVEHSSESVKHFSTILEDDKKHRVADSKQVFWLGLLVPLLTFLGVVLTVWVTFKIEDKRDAVQRNYEQAGIIQMEVQSDNKVVDELNKAMIDIRAFRDYSKGLCKNGVYTSNKEELYRERRQLGYNLVRVNYAVKRHFGEGVFSSVSEFIKLIDNDQNICSKNSPSDGVLREIEANIDKKIDDKIYLKQKEIRRLKSGEILEK
jgi:hypothetical protein